MIQIMHDLHKDHRWDTADVRSYDPVAMLEPHVLAIDARQQERQPRAGVESPDSCGWGRGLHGAPLVVSRTVVRP